MFEQTAIHFIGNERPHNLCKIFKTIKFTNTNFDTQIAEIFESLIEFLQPKKCTEEK